MNAKLAVVVVLAALAFVALTATTADASGVAVERGALLGPNKKAPAAAPKKPAPGGKGKNGKDGGESRVRRKVRKSPIKGQTPRTIKGKTGKEKGTAKVPKVQSAPNSGMGGVGAATRPPPPKRQAPAGGAGGSKASGAKGGKKAPATAPAKSKAKAKVRVPAGKKMKFRSLDATASDSDAEAAAWAEVNAEAEAEAAAESAVAVGNAFPAKDGANWKLSATYTITSAQLDAIKAKLPKLAAKKTFWHWDILQACTRWTRSGMSKGEMEFFDSVSTNMYAGGGLYFAEGPENSAEYGMFPCRIVIRAGTFQYSEQVMSALASQKLIPGVPSTEEKVALGQLIPFVHQYAVSASSRPPYADWWVTHSHEVFESFSGGNFPLGDGTYVTPHFSNNAKGGNGAGAFKVEITSSLDLYRYWNQLMDVDKLQPPLDVEAARNDLRGGLAWMKSFTFYMSYIDGASMFRALGIAPNDPFSVFEKDRFPNYQRVYEGYINGRLGSTAASLWGWSTGGNFGNGKDAAGIWAKNVLDNLLPGLYKELSAGGVMKFRDSEVRAGGDEEGRTFVATPGQVEVMKANPYLLVVDAPARADGSILTYYYYPDPLHRNPALKSRVSPALWAAMEEDIRLAGSDFKAFKATDRYKQHTLQLMNELILEAFTRVHGKSAAMDAGGLQIMLDLVSIHPCTDFNGRTTRFVGVVGAIESSLEPPIAFMSDFDLTTPVPLYGAFLKSGTAAYLKLKLALTAELLTGVCNGVMPDHYHVSYWAKFAGDALAPFMASPVAVTYDDSDWDTIGHRRFVPLMDKKLGKTWKGRASQKPVTPVVQTPGAEPTITAAPAPSQATPPVTNTQPAPVNPNACSNGKNSCSTCLRLNGADNHGCGWHKETHSCDGVYVINNNTRDYVLLRDDCPPRSG